MRPLSTFADIERRRQAALADPHAVPLEAYRAALAARLGDVPHVDPLDGGTLAACLLLLETPGPRGNAIRFVSRDNPTATARNITRFCDAAKLERRRMVLWNAVPWLIHAPGARNRAPRRAEIAAGVALLPSFLDLLPCLRVAVLAGRSAAAAAPVLREARPQLSVLFMPHPSPVYVNTAPGIAPGIVATLRQAAALLDEGQQTTVP